MPKKIIGIDIGGTKIRTVLYSGGRILKAREAKTPKNLAEFKNAIIDLLTWGNPIAGCQVIAIGAAGVISGTKIVFSPNIKYLKKFDFVRLSTSDVNNSIIDIGCPKIKLDNDARCFLRAEIAKNLALKKKKVLGLMFGTGIGRAFAKNGKVLKIKKFEYPERWEVRYQKVRDGENNKKLADFLAVRLKPIIKKYSPQIVIIGGGVAGRKGFLATFRHSQECRNVDAKITKSRLGQNAVALGAALMFINRKS